MNVSPVQHHSAIPEIAPERLANNSALTDQQKLSEASRQFEAILLRQILEAAQKTVIHSSLSDDSTAGSIYRDLVTNQLADSIARSGAFGLARTFEQQLGRQASTEKDPSATHKLSS